MTTIWWGLSISKKIFREKPSLQNIDELHTTAGTKNLLELHGSLFRVRCIDCGEVILEGTGLPIKITPFLLRSFRALKVTENKDSPICKALEGRGAPDPDAQAARIPEKVFQRKYSSRFWRSSNCTCQGSSKMSKANVWRPSQAACGLVWWKSRWAGETSSRTLNSTFLPQTRMVIFSHNVTSCKAG